MAGTDDIIKQYQAAFRQHGRTAAAVLCPKGRQAQRFDALLRDCPVEGRSILDFGCGLAHLKAHLDQRGVTCRYTGVDIVPDFIDSNRAAHPEARFDTISDVSQITDSFDVVLASGVFNLVYDPDPAHNLAYVESSLSGLYARATVALTVDFMTTHVDFQQPGAFHADPARILAFAQSKLSRRVSLNHAYLPYEFCLTIFKDAGIDRELGLYAS